MHYDTVSNKGLLVLSVQKVQKTTTHIYGIENRCPLHFGGKLQT